MANHLPFFVRESFLSFRRNRFMSLVAVGSITVALLALGTYFLVKRNAEFLLSGFEERVEVVAYFTDGLPLDKVQQAVSSINALPGVKAVEVVDPEQAAKLMSVDPEIKRFLETLGKNPLPASARIRLEKEFKNPESLKVFSAKLALVEGISEVNYGRETVERLLKIFAVLRLLLGIAGAVLCVAALLIVSNVIRLTVFNRREEISIMKLVGAGNLFVRAPFLLEGCLQGLAGGLLAGGIMAGLGRFVTLQVWQELHLDLAAFLPFGVDLAFVLALAACGLGLGFLASLFSVGRFLRA
jgi:cell division transport system permease protein